MAFNYGGRAELVDAVSAMIAAGLDAVVVTALGQTTTQRALGTALLTCTQTGKDGGACPILITV